MGEVNEESEGIQMGCSGRLGTREGVGNVGGVVGWSRRRNRGGG